jgi:hypothetical protein
MGWIIRTNHVGKSRFHVCSFKVVDPLSDILALLRPRTVETYGLVSGGTWALDFPRPYKGLPVFTLSGIIP